MMNKRDCRMVIYGVALRVLVLAVFVPVLHFEWFVPFIEHWANHPSLDPWTAWLQAGGDIAAFPYGVGMILISIPSAIATRYLGPTAGSLCLLLAFTFLDTIIGYVLIKSRARLAIFCSWVFGPIAIYVTYILGQTDVTIASLILLSVVLIKAKKSKSGGFVLAIAALFKLSALLFVPFILILVIRSPRERVFASRFLKVWTFTFLIGMSPMVYSHGFRQMVVLNRETSGLLNYTVSLGRAEPFMLVPFIYSAMLYWLWREGRTTSGVACVLSVASLAAVAIIAPSSTGWYLWYLPAMLLLSTEISKSSVVAINAFQIFVVFHGLIKQSNIELRSWTGLSSIQMVRDGQLRSLIQTLVMTSGILSVIGFLRSSISSQDSLRIGLKPITIGLAGDSGSGKSVLTESIFRLFPSESCQIIEGDNYHLYERNAIEWKTVTHLNPMANNLTALESDVRNAKLRKAFKPRVYDHNSGKFLTGDKMTSGDVLIVSGLHSLYINQKGRMYDIGVFLSMNDVLRENLKVKRDSATRGASEQQVRNAIAMRKSDSERFIGPQEKDAEIVFELDIEDGSKREDLRFYCNIRTRSLSFLPRLSDALASLVLVPHQLSQGSQIGELELSVRGQDLTAIDLMIIAKYLDPEICNLFSPNASFAPGTLGLQSLVVLLATGEKRRNRSD